MIDQFSLLHFAVGIIAYFWGFSATFTFVSHVIFELLENTPRGISFIQQFPLWPGGKPYADSYINQISDVIMTMIGWYVSRIADSYSREKHLYPDTRGNLVPKSSLV